MEKFEFKSAICTSVEQSKRLLKLGLKKETADMYITDMSSKGLNYTDDWQIGSISYYDVMSFWDSKGLQLEKTAWSIIPAWSLHRLMEIAYKGDILGCVALNFHERNIGAYYEQVIKVIEYLIGVKEFNKDYLERE